MEKSSLEIVTCPVLCSGANTICEMLPALVSQGVRAVEICLTSTPFFDYQDPDQIDRLVSTLDRTYLRVNSVHAPFGPHVDFSSFDNTIHDEGVDAQIAAIEMARLVGAGYTVVHVSGKDITDVDRKKRLDRARGVIRELATLAEDAGVRLAVENLPNPHLCSNLDDITWLVNTIDSPSVGVCFDTGHANLAGDFREWAAGLMPLTIALHIHDNDGTRDQHGFPGSGSIDWKAFTRIYRECNCQAALVIECDVPQGKQWREAPMLLREYLPL